VHDSTCMIAWEISLIFKGVSTTHQYVSGVLY